MKILFTGGGSGGHVFPIIAIFREIKKFDPRAEGLYLGPKNELELILLSQEGIKVKTILAGKIRRYFTPLSVLQNFFDLFFRIPIGILQSFIYLFFLAPDLIFSKGGYGALPCCLAGKILQIPIFLHESDLSPGACNRILGRFATEIFVSFPKTEYFPLGKMVVVGNPIRERMLRVTKEEAKALFGLEGGKPVLLILGGSQGAQRINDLILLILAELLENFEILHQSGPKNFNQVKAEAQVVMKEEQKKYYHLFPFLREKELACAYQVSDLVVSRAGSGSIFEIAAFQKPSILIPLPEAAQNHQLKNAYFYAKTGAALVIEEQNLTPSFFLEKLKYLISHPEELDLMSYAAKEFSKPKAAKIIASYIVDYLRK